MQIETGIHKQLYSIGLGVKQSGCVAATNNDKAPRRMMSRQ